MDYKKEYEKLEYKFSCVLCHATGSRLSYTSYDKETMYRMIDEHIQEMCDYAIEDYKECNEIKD